eukprot:318863-Rhodomonas_salina.1
MATPRIYKSMTSIHMSSMSFPATTPASDQQVDMQPLHSTDDLVRTVLAEIRGTPAMFASAGGTAAQWKIPPNIAPKIFGPSVTAGMPPELLERMLRSVILRKVRLVEARTNAKDIIGIQIQGLPKSEFTTTGDDHHALVMGSGKTKNLDVFNAPGDTDMGIQWMQEYPNFTQDNIRSEKVMRLNGADYYFVHKHHPVIKMLYKNQADLGTSISDNDMVNGQWYRVDLETFDDACNSLDHNVFSKTPQIFDLTNLTLKMKRPDNKGWLDPPMMHDEYLCAD